MAFTLVEMVLAMVILSVLMLAGQSAIRIAGHSVPSSSSPTYSTGNSQRGLSQLAADLSYARTITAMTSTSITFTVAARGSDSSPETICYSWDGVVGDPLTRQYNSDPAVNLVTSVNAFSLLFDKKVVASPTTYSTSATSTLYSYDNTSLLTATAGLASNLWIAQAFNPSLPSNATSYKITSVKFKACQDVSPGGQFYVQIRPSYGAVPGSQILEQATINGSSLPGSVGWTTVNFTSPVSVPAGEQTALTFQWVSNATYSLLNILGIIIGSSSCPPADIQYQSSLATSLSPAASTNSGSSWSTGGGGQGLYCYIYGSYTTPNATTYNYYLANVRASLQLGSNSDSAVRIGIPMLNLPQVTGP
ncbi:MAG TPA: prepilin-type N-terminal cleavage/methylation domain-containing protein [Tepidisphaeraceae bacterium]